jgi:primosomal protein DnaI
MNNVAAEMAKWIRPDFINNLTAMRQRVENHPAVMDLRSEYQGYEVDPNQLYQYTKSVDGCKACPGLNACPNALQGHSLVAEPDVCGDKKIAFTSYPCRHQIAADKKKIMQSRIKSYFVPESVVNMTFDDLENDPDRMEAIKAGMMFSLKFQRGKTTRGLYFNGAFGVGKSAIFGAIAQELAGRGVDVLMVYLPDFLGEVKDAIKTGEVESKLDALRSVDVLMIDDIGAEPLSIWTRDEVLGPILQRRMERLPTLYTSNLTMYELQKHLSQVKDERVPNPTKGARLIERIEPFVTVVKVGGKNRRRN